MRDKLLEKFASKLEVNPALDRRLVSIQADRNTPFYRWFKYREGFTSKLVRYVIETIHPEPGHLLDPFSGSGSALFAAQPLGWSGTAIELLPVGVEIMKARSTAMRVDPSKFARLAQNLSVLDYEPYYDEAFALQHIAITRGAFPPHTERQLTGYLAYCAKYVDDANCRDLARFAAFCILEDISYTRKDGQYLRWDSRSGRSGGAKEFFKTEILPFRAAINSKLGEMVHDLTFGFVFEPMASEASGVDVINGSCLSILPTLPPESVDLVLTSPPYCNRYDYTRTYALELVFLGCTRDDVIRLRQEMLSCTVENRAKQLSLRKHYESLELSRTFNVADHVFNDQAALHEVLNLLDHYAKRGELNNPHIARMVRNYFYEMCFVVGELARVLRPGGHIIMVNDNVRYAGEEVPVDLILSNMAEAFGLNTERIWTLPKGKGNSSQQMGIHGRSELRKCVYVWQRPTN
jgi:hypothetical protein